MKKTVAVIVLGLSAAMSSGFALNESLAAQTRVVFLVPYAEPPAIEPGDGYDRFTFTGRSVGKADVGSCEIPGPYHVQNGVATPGPNSSGGAIRVIGVIQADRRGDRSRNASSPGQYPRTMYRSRGHGIPQVRGDVEPVIRMRPGQAALRKASERLGANIGKIFPSVGTSVR